MIAHGDPEPVEFVADDDRPTVAQAFWSGTWLADAWNDPHVRANREAIDEEFRKGLGLNVSGWTEVERLRDLKEGEEVRIVDGRWYARRPS